MADVIFLLVVFAFFGLMVLLVKACDHIIGPDEPGIGAPAAVAEGTSALVGAPTKAPADGSDEPSGSDRP